MTHELKTWPNFFKAIEEGSKNFEVRFDDRGFAVGDTLILKEFDPAAAIGFRETGRKLGRRVTYILHLADFIEGARGWVAMGIEP